MYIEPTSRGVNRIVPNESRYNVTCADYSVLLGNVQKILWCCIAVCIPPTHNARTYISDHALACVTKFNVNKALFACFVLRTSMQDLYTVSYFSYVVLTTGVVKTGKC